MARRPLGASQATAASELDIVLKPLSRPELGEIRVDGVLAVGRAEQPFATYEDDFVVMLSRRHARIFCEDGVVYVADLGSSNGTTVNRAAVGQSPSPLRDGDEVCFGGVLSYRVEITPRTKARRGRVHPDALARLPGHGPGNARHHALSFPRQQDRRRRSPANPASMPRS